MDSVPERGQRQRHGSARAAGGRLVVEPRADRLEGKAAICVDSGGAPFGVLAVQQEVA